MSDPRTLFLTLRRMEARRIARSVAVRAFLGAAAALALAVLLVFVAGGRIAPPLLACCLAIPWGAALAGFWVGARRPFEMPRLLLRLDVGLGLDARLSSLYELVERGDAANVFGARLANEVARRNPSWKRGFAPSRRLVASALVGVLLYVASAATAPFLMGPRVSLPEAAQARQDGSVATGNAASDDALAEAVASPSLPEAEDEAAATSRTEAESSSQPAGVELVDLLAELRRRAGNEAVVSGDDESGSTSSDAGGEDSLDQLAQRLSEASGPLTEDEVEAVRNAAARQSDLAARIDEILSGEAPQTQRESLSSLLDSYAPPPPEVATAAVPRVNGTQPTPPGESGVPGSAPAPMSDGVSGGEPPSSSDESSSGTSGNGAEPGDAPIEPASPFESHFVAVAPPAAVSSTGPVAEYLTRGVPVEAAAGGTTAADPPAIDFTRVDSIMSARSVSTDALQTIRSYFERITRGGP